MLRRNNNHILGCVSACLPCDVLSLGLMNINELYRRVDQWERALLASLAVSRGAARRQRCVSREGKMAARALVAAVAVLVVCVCVHAEQQEAAGGAGDSASAGGRVGGSGGGGDAPHRRFEYKYSFKGPHLSRDGSIPFWVHTGSKSVIVVGNNGKLVYDHQNDGSTQALGTCLRDFRNKPYPVRAKITYYRKTLTVLINNGFTPEKEDYEFCTRVENMIIPPTGYFGISAATGGLADDHDVLSFLVFRLTEPGKECFIYYTFFLIQCCVSGYLCHKIFFCPYIYRHFIAYHQLKVLMLLFYCFIYLFLFIYLFFIYIYFRNTFSASVQQLAGGQQGHAGGLGSYETVQHFNDIKEHLHVVKRNIEHIIQRNAGPAEKTQCPELPPLPACLTTSHFVIFVVIQTLLFFGYVLYK
uniref:L-type lectin-like domain-containing protein n=1 Tax=Astyanax mexicanus TaxID=7994 RepID=A0A8B9H0A5_ASTMX